MSTITAKNLRREAMLLRIKVKIIRERLEKMEKKYGLGSETFKRKFEAGELGDEEEFFLWWSLLKALEAIEERLRD